MARKQTGTGFKFKKEFGRLSRDLLVPVGNIAQRHFQDNFDKQGFDNGSVQKWPEVQRRKPGTQAFKRSKGAGRTNPILFGKGTPVLSKSIRSKKLSRRAIQIATTGKANRYAGVHNEGLGNMPQRQFIGHSRKLNEKVARRIDREVGIVLNRVGTRI